jgi:hypothetical protein
VAARAQGGRSLGRVGLLALGLTALGLAFILGKASGPTGGAPPPSPPAPAPSRRGAVAAYLAQQAALGDPRLWREPARRRERELAAMVVNPALRSSLEASIRTAADTATPLGRALRAGRAVLARSAPLGYRIISYSPQRATIEVWVVSLLGGRGVPLDLRLARYRGTERWTAGAWRLAQIRSLADPSAVRFRGAVELSGRLTTALAGTERLRSEP